MFSAIAAILPGIVGASNSGTDENGEAKNTGILGNLSFPSLGGLFKTNPDQIDDITAEDLAAGDSNDATTAIIAALIMLAVVALIIVIVKKGK